MKKMISTVIALMILAVSAVPVFATGEGEGGNTPPDHVIINQVYGASDNGYASHSFIELYNPTGEDIDMSSWSVQYKSSADGDHSTAWQKLDLTGTIKAEGYYLIRCGAVTKSDSTNPYQVPDGDQEWNMQLHNKGLSVALVDNQTQLTEGFTGNVNVLDGDTVPEIEGLVDLAAAQGNDTEDNQIPPAYEGDYEDIQSKKKAIRRVNFRDTDNNKDDFEAVYYSETVDADNGPHSSASAEGNEGEGGDVQPEEPAFTAAETTNTTYSGFYDDTSASLKAKLVARYNAGASSADGGSAEITAYSSYNGYAYSVNGLKGTLDYFPVSKGNGSDYVAAVEGVEFDVSGIINENDPDFAYGDMTSVAISPDGKTLAVALQNDDYTENGKVAVFSCMTGGGLKYIGMAKTGVQPDMVTFNGDGSLILTANEGEPRNGYGDDAVDPAGSVSIIEAATLGKESTSAATIGFDDFDSQREALTGSGIIIKKNADPSKDFEPEYITVAGDMAYVTLQEANAVAALDLNDRSFTGIFSAGFEDYSEVNVDLVEDGKYLPDNYINAKGIRMPDGISSCVIDGKTYLLTANEGDSREWGDYANEVKREIESASGDTAEKVRTLDTSDYDGLDKSEASTYLFGGRSFTLFRVDGNSLVEVFDSGSDFEELTAANIPNYFNCSNDDLEIDSRSAKKGPEPESVTVGTVNGRTYAFVGLERIGGIMIYDITDPDNVKFDNYINSRNFSKEIMDDVSPEGLCFIGANALGTPLLLSSNEVSGTVSMIELTSAMSGQQIVDPTDEVIEAPTDPTDPAEKEPAASPETGDDTLLTFWLTLAALSGAAIVVTVICRMKSVSSK